MVKKNVSKTNATRIITVASLFITVLISPVITSHGAFAGCTTSNGTTTCTESTTFNVNVNETLTVAITRPNTWASGAINQLLTNKIGLSVTSNNQAGFTATMKSATASANLVNQSDSSSVITPLSSETTTSNFDANKWGYNIVTSGAAAPTSYSGMAGSNDTPIQIASTNASNTVAKDIYFAAKANGSVVSGTYTNSVIISVVSGVVSPEDNPVTPVNPITPSDSGETSHGNTAYGAVVATTTTSDSTTTTTTTESYAKPAGVTESTVASVTSDNSLATGLAIAAGASAATGAIIFFLAKRRRKDEEDDGSEEY